MGKKKSSKFAAPKNVLRQFNPVSPLGGFVAEQEAGLAEYFVGRDEYITPIRELLPLIVHIGPKGHGKSAIQRVILNEQTSFDAKVIELRPKDVALWTVARSEDLTLIDGIDPRWLNRTLWEYLFCIEVFRAEYPNGFGTLWSDLRALVSKNREQIRDLLERGFDRADSQSAAERFAELIEELKLEGTAGKVGFAFSAKTRDPAEKRHRRKTILSSLAEVMRKTDKLLKHDYLILLDDLDLNWTNTPTHRVLLEGLLSALHTLSSLPKLHFVVALRSDIYSTLRCEHGDKIENGRVNVTWTNARLKKLLINRIGWVLNEHVQESLLGRVFASGCWSEMYAVGFDNPRRLIAVAERAIVSAKGRGDGRVSIDSVRESIRTNSDGFLRAFATLHNDDYPGIEVAARVFRDTGAEFRFKDFEPLHAKTLEVLPSETRRWLEPLSPSEALIVYCDAGMLRYRESLSSEPRAFAENRDRIEGDSCFSVHPAYRAALGLK